jgi:hypothetical protein
MGWGGAGQGRRVFIYGEGIACMLAGVEAFNLPGWSFSSMVYGISHALCSYVREA